MPSQFAHPDLLRLLYLLPLWLLLVWPRAGAGVLHARGEAVAGVGRWWSPSPALVFILPLALRAAALGALIIALANPQRSEWVEERSTVGKAIGLVVDLSSSMLALDMEGQSSRLDVARQAATGFARGRPHDELALIAFANQSFTRVPITRDPELVALGVETLEIQLVGDGTDISLALLTGIEQLRLAEHEEKVLVLLTDGAHNGTDVRPLTAARVAETFGIKVHAISVLGPEDPIVKAQLEEAMRRAGVHTEDMQTVLAGITGITGGQYFHATSGAALDSIYRRIDALETPTEVVTEREIRHSQRLPFLVLALALVGMDGLLRGTRWGIIR